MQKDKSYKDLLFERSKMRETLQSLFSKSRDSNCRFRNLRKIILSQENLGYALERLSSREIDIANVDMNIILDKAASYSPVFRRDSWSIWDLVIMECIFQVIDPICEGRFSDCSFGFRPNITAENFISRVYYRLQMSRCPFVNRIIFPCDIYASIKHNVLLRKMFSLGIQDKWVISIIKRMFQCNRKNTGIEHMGVLKNILLNIYLHDFDMWVSSQWENNRIVDSFKSRFNKSGLRNNGSGYRKMRDSTLLKEFYFARFGSEIFLFSRSKTVAEKVRYAVSDWFSNFLGIDVSPGNISIIDARKTYVRNVLGFDIKLWKKNGRYVVKSHITRDRIEEIKHNLKKIMREIFHPASSTKKARYISRYNYYVKKIHKYFGMATCVSEDCSKIQFSINCLVKAHSRKSDISRDSRGRCFNSSYSKSRMLLFCSSTNQFILPIGFVSVRHPMGRRKSFCKYSQCN